MLRKLWSLLQGEPREPRLPAPENIVSRALAQQRSTPAIERFASIYFEADRPAAPPAAAPPFPPLPRRANDG